MRLSGDMFQESVKRVTERSIAMVEALQETMLQDGRPPGAVPVEDEREQYERLMRLFAQRDRRVLDNDEAWADMERLSKKFGQPPKGVLPGTM